MLLWRKIKFESWIWVTKLNHKSVYWFKFSDFDQELNTSVREMNIFVRELYITVRELHTSVRVLHSPVREMLIPSLRCIP